MTARHQSKSSACGQTDERTDDGIDIQGIRRFLELITGRSRGSGIGAVAARVGRNGRANRT